MCDVAGDGGQNGATFPIQEASWSGSFHEIYTLTASAPPGGCGAKYSTSPGALLAVEQAASPGVPVPNVNAAFTVANGTLVGMVSNIDFAVVRVNAGLTVLTITDTTPPPPSTGTLELCKRASDYFVSGSFDFNVTGAGGFSSAQSVLTNQCNDLTVPSGNVSITETARFPYALASVASFPSTAVVSSDLNTQSAVVSVPPNGMSTVFFSNATLTGYAKICKTLDRSQDNVLAGQTFTFPVTVTFNGSTILSTSVSVQAAPFGTTACTFLANKRGPIRLPLGSTVTATETVPAGASFQPVGTSISPANLNAGSSTGTAVFYVGNLPAPNNFGSFGAGSVTQATFTNEALGSVEVCKTSSSINQGTPFQFSVGGVGPISPVPVGLCSGGFQLPVGTTTITETPVAHVSTFLSTTAGGTLAGTTATVTVPYNTENIVTFDNEIKSGMLKVCKAQTSSDAGLQTTAFNFNYSYTVNGVLHSFAASLTPPKAGYPLGQQCAPAITVPVLNGDLSQVKITITEQTTSVPNVAVGDQNLPNNQGVVVTGPDTVVSQPTYPHPVSTPSGTPATVVVNSLEGVTNVIFINGIFVGLLG
ncbi:MAG: hypothetical protein IVW52_19690 [Acidimicrobiales bacterium]|nr:hypothetical protein [Acidimicrobiales bacterium]